MKKNTIASSINGWYNIYTDDEKTFFVGWFRNGIETFFGKDEVENPNFVDPKQNFKSIADIKGWIIKNDEAVTIANIPKEI